MHTSELLEAPDALVAVDSHSTWRRSTGDAVPLALTECVGYRVPLFLGGADTVEDLERGDMDVCWSLAGQLAEQTTGPPEGTAVAAVQVEPTRRRRRPRRRP